MTLMPAEGGREEGTRPCTAVMPRCLLRAAAGLSCVARPARSPTSPPKWASRGNARPSGSTAGAAMARPACSTGQRPAPPADRHPSRRGGPDRTATPAAEVLRWPHRHRAGLRGHHHLRADRELAPAAARAEPATVPRPHRPEQPATTADQDPRQWWLARPLQRQRPRPAGRRRQNPRPATPLHLPALRHRRLLPPGLHRSPTRREGPHRDRIRPPRPRVLRPPRHHPHPPPGHRQRRLLPRERLRHRPTRRPPPADHPPTPHATTGKSNATTAS